MKEKNLEISGLCEKRLKDKGDMVLHEDYRLIFSGREDDRHGLGVILAPDVAPYVEVIHSVSERIIAVSIKSGTEKVSIIHLYARKAEDHLRRRTHSIENSKISLTQSSIRRNLYMAILMGM